MDFHNGSPGLKSRVEQIFCGLAKRLWIAFNGQKLMLPLSNQKLNKNLGKSFSPAEHGLDKISSIEIQSLIGVYLLGCSKFF